MNHYMKRTWLALVLGLVLILPGRADEGMWLPLLLKELNEQRMQELGMRMSAEDIYSVNEGSLKDAIVSFGGFCTGQVISPNGLVLTNHHCGYGQVQYHSTVENDLLTKGFWAMNKQEELANPGLFVSFIVRIEDVTAQVLEGVTPDMTEQQRNMLVQQHMKEVADAATADTHYEASVKPFFYGTEYYMFVTETYNDVRLVGAPPSSIGKFGGDTDNWEWPRHTGDFSLFRIYTAPDGSPAEFSKDNVPMQARRHLSISLGGINPDEFTMVFGFPGRTQQYLTSDAVRLLLEETNPHRIAIREAKLAIMDERMKANDQVRIQYASKYASTANYWKKWIGESMGLKAYDAVSKKEAQEAQFTAWVAADATRQETYGQVLDQIAAQYAAIKKGNLPYHYTAEAFMRHDSFRQLNVLTTLGQYGKIVNTMPAGPDRDHLQSQLDKLAESTRAFFKDFDLTTDRMVLTEMINMYKKNVPAEWQPESFKSEDPAADYYAGDWLTLEWVEDFLAEDPDKRERQVKKLAAVDMVNQIVEIRTRASQFVQQGEEEVENLSRLYVAGLREMNADKAFWPDANSTMRVGFGKVGGMSPADGLLYQHYTTLDGVIAKEVAGVAPTHEFYVEPKLKELHAAKDYGRWADDEGYLPVGFLASNHTTGGNSGSPVLDADGFLIGLNFDRTWQSTMSDVMYNAEICRNIAVDIRYICFIIDKFAGAHHLIEEMTFVNVTELEAVD